VPASKASKKAKVQLVQQSSEIIMATAKTLQPTLLAVTAIAKPEPEDLPMTPINTNG